MPYDPSIDIERVIISAIIFDPKRFEEIADVLVPKDFIHIPHRSIFEFCLELLKKELPLDENFIRNEVIASKKIKEEEFLHIISTNPIANIEAYIKELKNASIKRELHSLANTLREKSLNGSVNSEDILDEIEREVYKISINSTQSDFRNAREIVQNTIARIRDLKERGSHILTGLDTGFKELNRLTTGFNKGELIIIGGRPSMGKTALALNMAQTILNHNNNGVAIFSLEMPAEQLMLRLLSSMTLIPLQELKVGNLDDRQWEELSRCSDIMSSKNLFIDDGSALSINQLRSKLRKLKSKNQDIEIAMIDYLQLMGNNNRRDMQRHEEISEISRGLKTLARELDIPIIALAQLSRSLESRDDKRPILSDLRESGAIEQDADVILFPYRDDVYRRRNENDKLAKLKKEGNDKAVKAYEMELRQIKEEEWKKGSVEQAEIIVAKNRNGETNTVKIQYKKIYTRFEDIALDSSAPLTPTKLHGEPGLDIDISNF